jgi:secreted trypsin-like serine protease
LLIFNHPSRRGVGPACLPFSYSGFFVPNGALLTAVGFGATEFARSAQYDTSSWILKKVSLYTNSSLATDCTKTVICAAGVKTGSMRGDTCSRDSGGPVYGYVNNKYMDFGIISRGMNCGGGNAFSYNVYIVEYFSWINVTTSNAFMCNKSVLK